MTTKQKFYNLSKIDKKNATYNVIFGERSNGKTFAALLKGIKNFLKTGEQTAYVRRWKEDITGRRAQRLYAGVNESGEVERLTKGEYSGIHYHAGRWYLCTYDDKGKAIYSDGDLLAFAFALSDAEHDKSTSFPLVTTVIFDEFLTARLYLPDEFVLFMNVVSTIVRRRENVKIYMLGNTVNKFCPYFQEMGLNHISKQKQGTIDVYKYGQSSLTVAVEYCSPTDSKNSKASKYFAFDNPKLEMITGGAWELSIYPHLPVKYKPKDILLTYFISFNAEIYQAEIIEIDGQYFTYIHHKTTPIKYPDSELIYTTEPDHRLNYSSNIFKPINKTQKKVLWFYQVERVFYQNNEIGDAINNFLKVVKRNGH